MSALIVAHTVGQFCCWVGFVWLFSQELRRG